LKYIFKSCQLFINNIPLIEENNEEKEILDITDLKLNKSNIRKGLKFKLSSDIKQEFEFSWEIVGKFFNIEILLIVYNKSNEILDFLFGDKVKIKNKKGNILNNIN
jgi:hypothetical protein